MEKLRVSVFCLTGALGNIVECSAPQGYDLFPQCHFVLPRVLPVTGWCSPVLFPRMPILGSLGSLWIQQKNSVEVKNAA